MIALLKKSGVALLVLALALIAQIPHAAHVFDRAPYIGQPVQHDSALSAWMLAYAYAIALESATLMFVVHGHRNASYGFAIASFAVNLSYYSMHGVQLFWGAFPAWLLSALLPIAIASYSHILTDTEDVPMEWPAWALRAWAKVQGVEKFTPPSEIIHTPVQLVAPIAQDVTPIVQEDAQSLTDDAQSGDEDAQPIGSDDDRLDGAPDPTDKEAYAKWLYMEKGLTQTALAAQFGVHRNTIRTWLNGAAKAAVQ